MSDFSKINGFSLGQRNAFEELVCQLARLEKFPHGSTFKRIEGAGGDGGVEALWTKPTGRKTGYQAKYWLRSGDIDWQQIDESVEQALATHPELDHYVVSMPCDLTAQTGAKGRRKTGWQRWEDRVKKWSDSAANAGNTSLTFEVWTASELLARLTPTACTGLRDYFFGEVVLDSAWFKKRLDEAVAALDERFHPEDHVEVHLEQLVSVVSRTPEFRKVLHDKFGSIKKWTAPTRKISVLSEQPDPKIIDSLNLALPLLLASETLIDVDIQHPWPIDVWQMESQKATQANRELEEWYWQRRRSIGDDTRELHNLQQCVKDTEALDEALREFHSEVTAKAVSAERTSVAFLSGVAGSGKSHLLARCAEVAVGNGRPAILILGQAFNDSEPWLQIANILGLPGRSHEQILGALDAAGKAAGVRALILLDGINEGVGSRFWSNHLAAFLQKVSLYPFVACIVSCRSEYFDLAVPSGISKKHPRFEVRGFVTPTEQKKAAQVYLDRRGIARPATPWLSPEFVNPLFLRSVCLALARETKTEIPVGLTGTKKILAFYLESVSRNIQRDQGAIISLVAKIGRAIRNLARAMYASRKDYLSVDSANETLLATIGAQAPKSDPDWLSTFLHHGVLRKDPNPERKTDLDDPEVIRFSFQRFQDFLMAEEALDGVSTTDGLFDPAGRLGFCVQGGMLAWEWRGLTDALTVLLPEKFGVELVDVLPGGEAKWWSSWEVQTAFGESARWREPTAFSIRALQLLNRLNRGHSSALDILIQVSVSADHPWNADMLHRNLISRKMPDRDQAWTGWVNSQDDIESDVGTIIDWCWTGQSPAASEKHQQLAATVLCWMFTSTNRVLRDKATKALSALLIANSGIFPYLLTRFADVNDPYVLERLMAAAFGACCRTTEHARLASYARAVFDLIFAKSPPIGLLLRDYALGIVELADAHGVLPDAVDLERCKPPYVSPRLRLSVSEAHLERTAKKAGGESIKRSAAGFMGDFGRYEIETRVNHFANVPLSRRIVLSPEQKLNAFSRRVVADNPVRIRAFEALENAANPYTSGLKVFSIGKPPKPPSKAKLTAWRKNLAAKAEEFIALLTDPERREFNRVAAPQLFTPVHMGPGKDKFDLNAVKRWVAKRAYDYGWTHARFPRDDSHYGGTERARVERIGKKYQWLALDELLSRLADGYWLSGEYGEGPKRYGTPLDVGFERDIDPTILIEASNHEQVSHDLNAWAFAPRIVLGATSESDLPKWHAAEDIGANLAHLPYRRDEEGVDWLVIHENQAAHERETSDTDTKYASRREEIRLLGTFLVKASEADAIAEFFKSKANVDLHHLITVDVTDAAYLYEAPWRGTWDTNKWEFDSWKLPTGMPYAKLASRYTWESHLDGSLSSAFSSHLPTYWVAREAGLLPDTNVAGRWRDSSGVVAFKELKGEEGGRVVLLRADVAERLLRNENAFITLLIAERNTGLGSRTIKTAYRRVEGVTWEKDGQSKALTWTKDYTEQTAS